MMTFRLRFAALETFIMDDVIEAKPNWKRRIVIAAGALVVLVVVLYFVATSAAFLKGFILPRVGQSMHAEVTVDDASISPFSSVTLKNLRVKTTGTEPLLAASEVRLRYGLMDIIKGHMRVDEATVEGAVVNIVTEADGSSNLDPLMSTNSAKKEPSSSKLDVDIKNVALKNATVRMIKKLKAGGPNVTEISGLNVTLDQLKNASAGKLTIGADLKMNERAATGTNSILPGKIAGSYDFSMSADLTPATVKGSTRVQVAQAEGSFKDAAGLTISLDADATPDRLNLAGVRFERNGQALGHLKASGPFDLAKSEGVLNVELAGIDRSILNLAGMDFAGSKISSTNKVEVTRKATFFAVDGKLTGTQLGIVSDQVPTPPVDLDFSYRISTDLAAETAALEKIALSARHKGAEFMNASVDRPLNLSWGESTYGLKDSTLRIAITNLNLADWGPLLGTNPPTGVINLGVRVLAQEDGRKLGLDINGLFKDLAVTAGTNVYRQAQVILASKGTLEEVSRINLPDFNLQARSATAQVLGVKGAIRYDLEKRNFGVQISADAALPELLAQAKMEGVKVTAGGLRVTANVIGATDGTIASGQAVVERLTGNVSGTELQDFQATVDYNVEITQNVAQIHRASIAMAQGFNRGGAIEATGRMELDKQAGALTFKIVDLNQFAMAPAMKSALGDKKLVSIAVNGSGTAKFSPGTNEITTEVEVSNLVVRDPAGTLPATPLGLGLNVDAAMRGNALDLRELFVKLTPTERATNVLQISAKIDTSTNAAPGVVAIKSAGLDLTRYYDIFAGNSTNAAAPAATGAASAEGEPEAMELPIKQLTATIAIDRLFLREVAISNWVATAVVSNNFVTLNPMRLGINGGPVTGVVALNLGVKGYTYDVAFNADRVPIEPFASSFSTATNGEYKGFLLADAKIRGAGITGAGLQKNLQGMANFSATNMDVKIVGPKMRKILAPISVVLRVPELLETPINWIDGQTTMGDGKIVVQKLGVESEAFYANVTGDIAIDKTLTNSPLNLPVALSLRKSLAQKALMINKTTDENAKYEPLPSFVTIKGTLGSPDPDIKKLALGGLLLNTVGGLTGNAVVGNAAAALNTLTGGGGSSTNASGTNASAGAKLLQGLGGLLGGGKTAATATNAVGTVTNAINVATNTANAATNATATNAPAQNILNLFKKNK
jgi:type II secretion system protein N